MLELYFTRAVGSFSRGFDFGIYVATRSSDSEPWDTLTRLTTITGTVTEAPSISFDGRLLYYHKKVSNVFRIYVAEREEID